MPAGACLPAEGVVLHVLALLGVGLCTGGQGLEVVTGGGEPLVVVAGVVQDEVGDDMDVPLLALGHQLLEVGHGAVLGIDVIVVPNVILVVGLTGMDGHEPDTVDAQLLEVVQLGDDTLQVTNAVTVGVAEGIDENFVEGTVVIIRRFAKKGDLSQCCFGLCGLSGFQSRPRGNGGGGFSISALRGASEQQQNGKQQAHNSHCSVHGINP